MTRLCCEKCGAGLVPAFNGLKCPRMNACTMGGFTETAFSLAPAIFASFMPHGITA